jgi:hypothetical protein
VRAFDGCNHRQSSEALAGNIYANGVGAHFTDYTMTVNEWTPIAKQE